jgi:hypothetical protein
MELLEAHLQRGSARAIAAKIFSLPSFRDAVRRACFESREARDHVLAQVSDDTLAVLEAMGLCGAEDKKGRRICIPMHRFRNKATKADLYDVLVKQYGLLFGLEPRAGSSWSQVAAQELIGGRSLVAELQTELSKLMKFARSAEAGRFFDQVCRLQKTLQRSISWRLQEAGQPRQLLDEFRANAQCPPPVVARLRKNANPSPECQRVVEQHARLFSARLTESVVMQALSFLTHSEQNQLSASLKRVDMTRKDCDFKKMRLSWHNEDGNMTYLGNIQERPADLTGLDAFSKWRDGENIQDSLTRKTKDLSRLSDNTGNRTTPNVLTEVFLNVSKHTNPTFDTAYSILTKRPRGDARCPQKLNREETLLALAELWSRENSYPPFFTTMLKQRSSEPGHNFLRDVFRKTLEKLVKDANDESDRDYDAFAATRRVWLEISNQWYLPLTDDASDSTGLFRLVSWMICNDAIPPESTALVCQINIKGRIKKTKRLLVQSDQF